MPKSTVKLTDLILDVRLQARADLDQETLADYVERMMAGDSFPPILVFDIDGKRHVVDGFHRVHAAQKAQLTTLNAIVQVGTFEEAQIASWQANTKHGKRRSRADLQAIIKHALLNPVFVKRSDSWLAKDIGCKDTTVNRMREEMESTSQIGKFDELLGEDGKMRPRKRAAPAPFVVQEAYTLEAWDSLSEKERTRVLSVEAKSKLNRQELDADDEQMGNIEWAKWSWNPITGCKHDCPYCYARDIAERFYPEKFAPTLRPFRLLAPRLSFPPDQAEADISLRNIFTCSMADLFGRWVPREWIDAVLRVVAESPQWNFLFLTKFPLRMSEFEFPANAWVGTSVDCQARVKGAEKAFAKIKATVKWLSCEPLIEPLQFADLTVFDWIVIGGASRSTQTPEWRPPREWVERLEQQAWNSGCSVYEKTNALRRWRQYPNHADVGPQEAPEVMHYLKRAATADQFAE